MNSLQVCPVTSMISDCATQVEPQQWIFCVYTGCSLWIELTKNITVLFYQQLLLTVRYIHIRYDAMLVEGVSSLCQVLAESVAGVDAMQWVMQWCWWLRWNQLLHQRCAGHTAVVASYCRPSSESLHQQLMTWYIFVAISVVYMEVCNASDHCRWWVAWTSRGVVVEAVDSHLPEYYYNFYLVRSVMVGEYCFEWYVFLCCCFVCL